MFSEKRSIKLPKGEVLEVELTEAFLERVRLQFNLSQTQKVEDDHIRMFFFGAVKNAIDAAEQEIKQ